MIVLGRIVLALTSLMHLGFGIAYTFWPVKMASLTKYELTAPLAVTEMRAFYGGLELGLAVFLGICAIRTDWIIPGLTATVLIYGGIIVARSIGMALDSSTNRFLLKIIAVEALTCFLAGLCLLLLKLKAG